MDKCVILVLCLNVVTLIGVYISRELFLFFPKYTRLRKPSLNVRLMRKINDTAGGLFNKIPLVCVVMCQLYQFKACYSHL